MTDKLEAKVSEKMESCPSHVANNLGHHTAKATCLGGVWEVICTCGWRGPLSQTEYGAIAAWNSRRAEPSGWRAEREAPRDGSKILGVSKWDKDFAQVVYWRKYFDGSEGWACKSGDQVRIDWWTPYTMPAPPSDEGR